MERTFSPMVRQFSAIAGLQQAYTLVYSLDPDGETGCRLNNNITPARGNVKGGSGIHAGHGQQVYGRCTGAWLPCFAISV